MCTDLLVLAELGGLASAAASLLSPWERLGEGGPPLSRPPRTVPVKKWYIWKETRLEKNKLEHRMFQSDVVLMTVPAMLLAARKMIVPRNEQVPDYLGNAFQELWAFVREHDLKVMGPHMTIWHQGPEVLENEVVEAAVEVDTAISPWKKMRRILENA
jgi:hypothetical protein